MMNDRFFTKQRCDRCGNKLNAKTMSWFTEEVICMDCSDRESRIKARLPNGGRDYEGCGYVPKEGE